MDHAGSPGPARPTDALGHLPGRQRQVLGGLLDVQLPAVIRALGSTAASRAAAGNFDEGLRDTHAADSEGQRAWSPTTDEVAAHLRPAIVLRTKSFDGRQIRNHSKFISIDHRFLLVTSANFSWSAENANLEFGLLVDNPNLAESVERELREAEDSDLRAGNAMSGPLAVKSRATRPRHLVPRKVWVAVLVLLHRRRNRNRHPPDIGRFPRAHRRGIRPLDGLGHHLDSTSHSAAGRDHLRMRPNFQVKQGIRAGLADRKG